MGVLDYKMDVEGDGDFVLSYQPWTLAEFSNLLKGIFGSGAAHTTYADFFKLSEVVDPAFYIHVIEKPATKRWYILGHSFVSCAGFKFFTLTQLREPPQPRCQEPGHSLHWTAVAKIL